MSYIVKQQQITMKPSQALMISICLTLLLLANYSNLAFWSFNTTNLVLFHQIFDKNSSRNLKSRQKDT
jgi:hypothetical protein